MAEAGIPIVLHDEHFADRRTPDEIWLAETSRMGWLVATCDKALARAPLFLQTLAKSSGRVFILDGLDGATSEGKARCLINCYEKMANICRHGPAPLLWHFDQLGQPKAIDFRRRIKTLRRRSEPQ